MCVRRELDGQAGALNLWHLLHDMEDNARLLSRDRYARLYAEETPREIVDDDFQRLGPLGETDGVVHILASAVRQDRESLEVRTRPVEEYAERLVAHRTPVGELTLSIEAVDEALGAIFECMNKYHVLLTGTSIAFATPVPQFDFLAAFRQPWIRQGFKEPGNQKFEF